MAWSYDNTEATNLDIVRGLIGDTNSNRQQLDNETILGVLDRLNQQIGLSSRACVLKIMSLLARSETDSSVGSQNSSRNVVWERYRTLYNELTKLYPGDITGGGGGATATFTGALESEHTTADADTSQHKRPFGLGMDDYA